MSKLRYYLAWPHRARLVPWCRPCRSSSRFARLSDFQPTVWR